jgi:hypothetical protein
MTAAAAVAAGMEVIADMPPKLKVTAVAAILALCAAA